MNLKPLSEFANLLLKAKAKNHVSTSFANVLLKTKAKTMGALVLATYPY
jgi:hypothetical protein